HHLDLGEDFAVVDGHVQLVVHGSKTSRCGALRSSTSHRHRELQRSACVIRQGNAPFTTTPVKTGFLPTDECPGQTDLAPAGHTHLHSSDPNGLPAPTLPTLRAQAHLVSGGNDFFACFTPV